MSSSSADFPIAEGPGSASGTGHWAAEQAPEALLAALTEFLAPYRAQRAAP